MNNKSERLALNINDVTLEYAKKRKKVDDTYIKKIFDLAVKEFRLNSYCRNVSVKKGNVFFDRNSDIYYNKLTKIIYYNLDKVMLSVKKMKNSFNLSYIDVKYLIFTYVNTILLHELEHAYQQKRISYGRSFEDVLLKSSWVTSLDNPSNINTNLGLYYKENYDLAIEERLAIYYSNELTIRSIDSLDVEFTNLRDIYVYLLFKDLLKGYKKSLSPTYTYLKVLGNEGAMVSIPKGLSLEEKFKYGLKITPEEYQKFAKTRDNIRQRIKK